MGEWAQNAAVLLKDTMTFCSTVTEHDEIGFNRIKHSLSSILDVGAIPQALENQVKRTSKLVEHISSGQNDFDKGLIKLRESLNRMVDSIPAPPLETADSTQSHSEDGLGNAKSEVKATAESKVASELRDIGEKLSRDLESFKKSVNLFEQDRDMAVIELAIKMEEWYKIYEGLGVVHLQTLIMAVREELLNNPEFHIDTLRRFFPLIESSANELMNNVVHDISDELLSTIFEVEDSYIHQDASPQTESHGQPVDNITIGEEETFEKLEKESHKPTISADIVPIPSENYDLIMQFVQNQSDVLPLFEALALNYDDNPSEFGDEIRGILHTWKGEFGVLDLQKFSQLCHFLEDEMEKDDFRSDTLFRFKDLLSYKLKEIKGGAEEVLLTDEEISYLVTFNGVEPVDDASSPEKESKPGSIDVVEYFDESSTFPMPDDDDLLNGFILESREHLEIADASILELEKEGHNGDLIDSVFRAYHTIKGVASFLSLEPIRFLAHEVENYIDLIRAGNITLDQEAINLSLEGTDILKNGIENVADAINEQTYTIPSGLNDYLQRLQGTLESAQNPEKPSGDETPPVEEMPVATSSERVVDTSPEEPAVTPEVATVTEEEASTETPIDSTAIPAKLESADKASESQSSKSSTRNRKANLSETVRVPVDRLDQLIDTIGEAVIAQSMFVADEAIASIKKPELVKKIAQAEQIMRQVQELSMGMRMVSIKPTFQKMARLVRDLSLKFNKDIEFVMEGQDTDIDKSLVEKIGDPLIHMVRNALDHGIEASAEERTLMGKNAKATVVLRAFHKSGSIYIEIEDDGRGLDKERILKKGIKQGLVKADQELSENEIFNLIFKPGFSTAEKITDISGRGVGMDVVRRNIMDMRGAIHVSSELGKGTIFSIRLPLTLAIIDGMVVSACGERYIIPKLSIVESIIPDEKNLETVLGNVGHMIKFRGRHLVFSRLEDIFNLNEGQEPTKVARNGVIIIIEDLNGKRVGLFVDKIIGQRQVVIKSLGEGLNVDGIAGGAIMSDGSVNLIVDVSSVVSMIQ